ncbi:NAD(+) synthase [Halocatena marina]|uniref:NAD(+) synthase n=1 Tax=Halocatena marina TaxID=2934937 RepID=UPI00200E71BA|nr:NAD(+) synthase [Halocatena marina]
MQLLVRSRPTEYVWKIPIRRSSRPPQILESIQIQQAAKRSTTIATMTTKIRITESTNRGKLTAIEDPESILHERITFIQNTVETADATGVVVNLSGNVDSTVTAKLAVEALGNESVDGLIFSANTSCKEDIADAQAVASELNIDVQTIDIQPVLTSFVQTTATDEMRFTPSDPLLSPRSRTVVVNPIETKSNHHKAMENVAARIQMMFAYFEANTSSRLVLGNSTRTELLTGHFTKFGNGGVDLFPLGDLYKTEVLDLARSLDVPQKIVEKEPTVEIWKDQTDASEHGASYETIDAILQQLVDDQQSVEQAADTLSVDSELVAACAELYTTTAHKRTFPPTPAEHSSEKKS